MKSANGSVRRNFFRSSSRRLRVGPGGSTPTSNGSTGVVPATQQSLIAGARGGSKRDLAIGQQQSSPGLDSSGQPDNQMKLTGGSNQQQANNGRSQAHNSPSDFGGSSSGGFTYFSGKFSLAGRDLFFFSYF